jgi:hypothetical protein
MQLHLPAAGGAQCATRASAGAVVGIERRAADPLREPGQRHAAHLQAVVDDREQGLRAWTGLLALMVRYFQTACKGWLQQLAVDLAVRVARKGPRCGSRCGPAPCRPAAALAFLQQAAALRLRRAAPPAARSPGPAADAARRRRPPRPPGRWRARFLDLGRADAVARHLDHVVAAADEVQEALFVHAHGVARPDRHLGQRQRRVRPGAGRKRSAVLAGSFQ